MGFSLPEGDVARGEAAYVELGCNACHLHASVPQAADADQVVMSIVLGGESSRVRTYGELVTSVINPSHRVARRGVGDAGQSEMAVFNDVMTVTQMVDLVAFLQASYQVSPHHSSVYPSYWYPDSDKAD